MFQFVASFWEVKDFASQTLLEHLGWLLLTKSHVICLYDIITCRYHFTPPLLYNPLLVLVSQGL